MSLANPTASLSHLATQFAPSGTLRAAINLGNPILARRDDIGLVVGVSVDMAQAFAQRLGLPVELVVVDTAAKSVALVTDGAADIGFFAIDPVRGAGIAFTAAYVQIEGAYLVRADSPLTDNAQVDAVGTRIAVGQGSAYDLCLSREIKRATLARAPSSPAVVDYFLQNQLDVAAGVKQQLEFDAKRLSNLRLLPGRFMVIAQAMGQPKTRSAACQNALHQFVEDMKSTGVVAQALARQKIEGAVVAPALALKA